MAIKLTAEIIEALRVKGVSTLLKPGPVIPDDVFFEPPCSIKWMQVQHSLSLGAFSYAVSGFYFGCRIERYCSMGEEVQIGRHPHPMHWVSTSPFFYQSFDSILDMPLPEGVALSPQKDFLRDGPPVTAKITRIGNDVWIGHGAFVLPGVTIGDGAVIAAQSVVTRDVPPYAIVAGSPARTVRFRFSEDQRKALLDLRWWDFAPWQLKQSKIDDIDRFIGYLNDLRARGEETYRPDLISPRDFV
mgnify:CR=1 FL=1